MAHGEVKEPHQEFDGERHYPMLNRFQVAEAYANGSMYKIQLTSPNDAEVTINNWVKPDGSISDELYDFFDFLWAHK